MTELKDLSPEQQKVVESWGQGISVLAGAGSGKTTTLVIKCAELLRLNPKARFAAVSFTERSASDLRAKLSERLALEGHWVMTIHGLCGAILREYPREAGFDGEESMLSENEAQLLWTRALETLWFEELPEAVRQALDRILARETRDSLMDLLKRLRELEAFGVLEKLSQSEDAATGALREVGQYVLERYDRFKRRRGALDFNDLEKGADRALEHPAVREAFQKQFDLVLVDEFQDTNPLQARIVWRFCRPDSSNLCVVGDPKQSIYRFRDADVTVFEDFCSRLPSRFSLTWNFRSRPPIIDFANRVCAPAFLESGMAYEALVPKRDINPAEQAVIRLDLRTPAELGRWIRAEVARGIPLHEMALLLRKIRGNEKWLKALTGAGIPIAIGSGGLFWEDPRIRELVAFLKWWDNPGHSLSGAVFLRAPWVAVPDETLDQWLRQDPTGERTFWVSSHPLALALLPFRRKAVRPGELLSALLIDDRIESELGAQCLGLWHRVEELSARGLDFHAVILEITKALEQSRRERDVPPPRNQGQLSVLTLHASKGLEFPHVILVDLGAKSRAGDAPLLFWDRVQGAYLGARDAEGEREKKDPIEIAWREQEKAKNLAESKRVFYVALTRARERLILACPELPEPKIPAASSAAKKKPASPFSTDDWRSWVEQGDADLPRISVEPVAGLAAPEKALGLETPTLPSRATLAKPSFRKVRPRHSVTEWNLLSRCPRAYEWTYVRPVPVAEGIPEIGLFTGTKVTRVEEQELDQKELGSRVHACLEHADFEGLKKIEKEVGEDRFSAESVISWAMSAGWMAPPNLASGRKIWTELEFEVPVDGGRATPEILVGSIDRLVREESSSGPHYFLIDFKISEKPKSVEVLLESYQTQMELYAWSLGGLGLRKGGGELEKVRGLEKVEALLVNIAPRTIQAIPLQLGQANIPELAAQAATIVDGGAGLPKPGRLCRFCDFRALCPEAAN